MEEKRKEKERDQSTFRDRKPKKREIRYFTEMGRPLNINQAQINFRLDDDEENGCFVLTVCCYKHLGRRNEYVIWLGTQQNASSDIATSGFFYST